MNPIQKKQLAKILRETDATGQSFVKLDSANKLLAAGFVEVNTAVTDATGAVATRITAAGRTAAAEPATAPVTKPTFSIVQASGLPDKVRAAGVGAPSRYPFDDLAAPANGVYSKFTVRNEDVASGDAFKSMGSNVSSANARYSTVTGTEMDANGVAVIGRGGHPKQIRTYQRKFEAFRIEGGVDIYRIV